MDHSFQKTKGSTVAADVATEDEENAKDQGEGWLAVLLADLNATAVINSWCPAPRTESRRTTTRISERVASLKEFQSGACKFRPMLPSKLLASTSLHCDSMPDYP